MFNFNKDFGELGNLFLRHICSRSLKENKGSHSTCRHFYFIPPLMVPLCVLHSHVQTLGPSCVSHAWLKNGAKSHAVLVQEDLFVGEVVELLPLYDLQF